MNIEYHPAIVSELKAIKDYYDERVPGLGAEFVHDFEQLVLRIADTPARWLVVQGDVRRALMRRWPYIIYFRQPQPGLVRVTVVKHGRRHPAFGLDRR